MEQEIRGKSRADMIEEARRCYGDSRHKKSYYYSSMNKTDAKVVEKVQGSSVRSFQIRLSIAAFLFLMFLAAKETNFEWEGISTATLTEAISSNALAEQFEEQVAEVWKNLEDE